MEDFTSARLEGSRVYVAGYDTVGLEGTLRHGTTADEPPDYALVLLLSLR